MFNIKSKLINVSALARILNTRPTTLYNRINGIGSHKKLSENELTEIENLIKKHLKL